MSVVVLSLVFVFFCAVVCPSVGDPVGTRCEQIKGAPSCVCRTPTGKVIDLTKLASYDGTPRFTGLIDPINFSYDYNPCFGFNETDDCENVQMCESIVGAIDGQMGIVDYGNEQIWIDEAGEPYVYYTGRSEREVFVYLKCDPAAIRPVITAEGSYKFTARSNEFCSSADYPVKCEATDGAPSCVCNTSRGTIDLTKLASFDGTPRFTGVPGNPDYVVAWDYNPCAAFTTACRNVHSCRIYTAANQANSVGDYGTEQMMIKENGEVFLHYTTGKDYYFREMTVYLKCDPSVKKRPILAYKGEPKFYVHTEFTLTSCHACPGGC